MFGWKRAGRGWWDKELVKAFVDMMRSKGLDRKSARIPRMSIEEAARELPQKG